jgi:hypothetical protein
MKNTKNQQNEKINLTDRPLANLNKMRREKTQISKIRNRKGELETNTTEIQRLLWKHIFQ